MNKYVSLVFVVIQNLLIHSYGILYEGDHCKLENGQSGKCVQLFQCPSAIDMLKQSDKHPKNCGFIRNTPIVCCPKLQAQTSRLAEQKCESFQIPKIGAALSELDAGFFTSPPVVPVQPPSNHKLQLINPVTTNQNTFNIPSTQNQNSDGTTRKLDFDNINSEVIPDNNKFIIGGTHALIREFPHMAALGYTAAANKKIWLCGGSLVSEQYVLTAAHCLYSKQYGNLQWVRLGDINLDSRVDQSDQQDYRVIQKIAHPGYKPPSVYHDIALLQLDRNIIITSFVKPACLFIQEEIPEGVKIFATGWGLTQVGGNTSNTLQKVELDLFTEEECDVTYQDMSNSRRLKQGILYEQQFCVGGKNKEKDTCQGDSGGPLQITTGKYGDTFYIVGVTSFGKSCGLVNVPGVYTRVSYYASWLEMVLWPNGR